MLLKEHCFKDILIRACFRHSRISKTGIYGKMKFFYLYMESKVNYLKKKKKYMHRKLIKLQEIVGYFYLKNNKLFKP